VIPLWKAWAAPRQKRAERSVNVLKEFLKKHLKSENILISSELNEILWKSGAKRPPRKLMVKVQKVEDAYEVKPV